MPLYLLLLALDIALVVHAAKTGRLTPWAYVIMLLPGIGAVAYIVAELMPEWLGSYRGRRTRARIGSALNPERAYRQFKDNLETVDTIANRVALAEECLTLERFEEARGLYKSVVALPLGDEPSYFVGLARAELGLGRHAEAIATLEQLRQKWPKHESAEGHLLYARALEAGGRSEEALEEYEAVGRYFPGAEARTRHAMLLARLGRSEAKPMAAEIVRALRRSPGYVRKNESAWLAEAERIARG
ncbi:MAG: tetratricopeptide repeat protein [Bauldia sp.]